MITALFKKPLSVERALELCCAQLGEPCSIIVRSNGAAGITPGQRADALKEFEAHEAAGQPTIRQESEYPAGTTLEEYRAAYAVERAAWDAWWNRRYQLEKAAHAFSYRVVLDSCPPRYGFNSFSDAPDYTLEGALKRVGVTP